MGWLDNLLGRGRDSTPKDKEPTRTDDAEPESEVADELEAEVHSARDDQVLRQGRIPPGT
jgi:hypothetical protein